MCSQHATLCSHKTDLLLSNSCRLLVLVNMSKTHYSHSHTTTLVCSFVCCCHNSRINKSNISDEDEKNRNVDALQWCLDVLQQQQQQHPDQTKLHAIDVGGTAEQSVPYLLQMPMFPLFSDKLATTKLNQFGQWFWHQAPRQQLRNICVQVRSHKEFDEMLQLLHKLPPANNRRFFGVQFNRSIDMDSFADKLQQLLLLLRKKAPALDTLCLVLHLEVSPEMFDVSARHMHPTVTSFCLQTIGFVIFCFRIHYTRLFHVK